MSLDRTLARWEAAGLIDGPTGARIRAFEKSPRTPIALYALGVLGAGTVALGIISLIAANWDAIPATMKLAGDLLIGLVLAMATYVAVRRGGGWPGEVLIMLFYGFTLASIALVGQVYQLTNPTYQALLVWSAATLPLVLLGRSYALAALAAASIALTHTVRIWPLIDVLEPGLAGNRDRSAAILFASPLLYVVLARVPWLVRNRPELSRTVTALAWVAVLVRRRRAPARLVSEDRPRSHPRLVPRGDRGHRGGRRRRAPVAPSRHGCAPAPHAGRHPRVRVAHARARHRDPAREHRRRGRDPAGGVARTVRLGEHPARAGARLQRAHDADRGAGTGDLLRGLRLVAQHGRGPDHRRRPHPARGLAVAPEDHGACCPASLGRRERGSCRVGSRSSPWSCPCWRSSSASCAPSSSSDGRATS